MTHVNTNRFRNGQQASRLDTPWLSKVTIRVLREPDLNALEWDGEYTHFRRLYRQIFQSTHKGRARMWVADLSGSGVIGQLFVHLDSTRKELADGTGRAYIFGFRVKPAYRGFGLGERMLDIIERDLLNRNYRWVTLNVGRQNQDARRFYERLGYRVVAKEPGRWSYLDDRGCRREVHEPSWRMQKQIS